MTEVNFSYPMGSRQITDVERMKLRELCEGAKNILEIGSWVGDSTSEFADYARSNDAMVYCVDWFKGNPKTDLTEKASAIDIYDVFRSNIADLGLSDYVRVLHMTSQDAAPLIVNDFFDLIFLDADHRYEHIAYDISVWFPKLKPDGFFVGHDYDDNEYNEEFINLDFVQNKHHGVIKAVQEKFKKFNTGVGSLWWVQK